MNDSRQQKATALVSAALACGLLLSASTSACFAGKFAQNHPRRAEVLHRDNNLNNRANKNYGNLGGHYGQIEHQDQAIRHQEKRDAAINGGYITKGQKQQINREENHVSKEIKQDKQ